MVGIVADEDDDGQAPQQGKQQQSRQRPPGRPQKKPPSGSAERRVLIDQVVQLEKAAHFHAWKHKENARLKHLGYGQLDEALNEDLVRYRSYLEGKQPAEVQAGVIAAN